MRRVLFSTIALLGFLALSCSDDSARPRSDDPANNPPVIAAQNDTSTTIGDTLRLYPSATDPDGDSLTYGGFVHVTLSDIKQGTIPQYEFKGNPGFLEFVPRSYDVPSRQVTLHVRDARGGADSTTCVVFVD